MIKTFLSIKFQFSLIYFKQASEENYLAISYFYFQSATGRLNVTSIVGKRISSFKY